MHRLIVFFNELERQFQCKGRGGAIYRRKIGIGIAFFLHLFFHCISYFVSKGIAHFFLQKNPGYCVMSVHLYHLHSKSSLTAASIETSISTTLCPSIYCHLIFPLDLRLESAVTLFPLRCSKYSELLQTSKMFFFPFVIQEKRRDKMLGTIN